MRKPILYLDFETSPIVGWAWSCYDAELFHIEQDVQIISVAWSWEGEEEIYALGVHEFPGYKPGLRYLNDKKLVKSFQDIFAKAEMVVAHNGNGFDFKLWRTRLIVNGFNPHHNLRELDTKRWAKRFRFTNNSQNNIARQLKTPLKEETVKNLHYKCLELGTHWDDMISYNKNDVVGLKAIAHRMAPFVLNTPNANLYQDTTMNCTNPLCGSANTIMEGRREVKGKAYRQRYSCNDCGRWFSGARIPIKVLYE